MLPAAGAVSVSLSWEEGKKKEYLPHLGTEAQPSAALTLRQDLLPGLPSSQWVNEAGRPGVTPEWPRAEQVQLAGRVLRVQHRLTVGTPREVHPKGSPLRHRQGSQWSAG